MSSFQVRPATLRDVQAIAQVHAAASQAAYQDLVPAEALNATVVNMRWVKPLDTELLLQLAATHEAVVTLEEGCIQGGAGSAVCEALSAAGLCLPVLQLGLPDVFIEHGDPAKLLALQGLDAQGIEQAVRQRFGPSLLPPPTTEVGIA